MITRILSRKNLFTGKIELSKYNLIILINMESIASDKMNNEYNVVIGVGNISNIKSINKPVIVNALIESIINKKYAAFRTADEDVKYLKDFPNVVYELLFNKDNYYLVAEQQDFSYKNSKLSSFFNNLNHLYPLDFLDRIHTEATINEKMIIFNYLRKLVTVGNTQSILKSINLKKVFKSILSESQINSLFFESGVSSTLPVFLEIDKYVENKKFTESGVKSILSAASRNSDIRVLKYIVNNFDKYHNHTQNNHKYIKYIIFQVFSYHIPVKYSLRRIKLLNSKIDFKPYFYIIIDTVSSLEVLLTLAKYYGKDYVIPTNINNNNLSSLLNLISESNEPFYSCKEKFLSIFNLLSSNEDKVDFISRVFKTHNTFFDVDPFDFFDSESKRNKISIREISRYICRKFLNSNFFEVTRDKSIYLIIKKVLEMYPPVFEYGTLRERRWSRNYLLYMPYVNYYFETDKNGKAYFTCLSIKLNYIKFGIKLWMRRNQKIIRLNNKFLERCKLQSEIMINEDSIFQAESSYNNDFTSIPPRHILPFEINNLKITPEGYYLIKEKADGCLVDFIPKDVEPKICLYNSNITKSEFIEDLDLYLIYDVDIKGKSHIERYNILRKEHPFTSETSLKIITTFSELKKEIELERETFKRFLNEPYSNYRVYPKAAWLVKDVTDIINEEIVENIIQENDYKFICLEGEYLNDGLIITPLDGTRELKVKPKNMHTIDLLYNGDNWVDREGNVKDFVVKNLTKKYNKNSIWRCYPTLQKNPKGKYTYEAKDFRFDKEKPNKSSIVDMIYNLHLINWDSNLESNMYYHKKQNTKSPSWRNLCKIQNNHLQSILSKVSPENMKNWLDLGCGANRLLRFINKYNPNIYNGIDFDINNLLRGMKLIDNDSKYQTDYILSLIDLKDWTLLPMCWNSVGENFKADYIVSNFSLQHFHNEKFWAKLEDFVIRGSIFIFNIVNSDKPESWSDNNSYLSIEEKSVKFKFECHEYEMVEQLIREEDINKMISRYNWEVIHKIEPVGSNLDSKYLWYVLRHN